MKKLGDAFKKMSQRAMWRGNRDDAMAIESHGIHGMRSNLQNQPQNVLTHKAPLINSKTSSTNTSTSTDKDDQADVNKKVIQGGGVFHNVNFDPNKNGSDKKLGGSIMDALE